jgi:hypothetical protein
MTDITVTKTTMTDIPVTKTTVTDIPVTKTDEREKEREQDIDFVKGKGATFTKFDKDQWNRVEKKIDDPFTKLVHGMMCNLGDSRNEVSIGETKIVTIGDDIYLDIIRPELVNRGYVSKIVPKVKLQKKNKGGNKKGKQKKKGITKEEIIRQNTLKRVQNSFESILNTFSDKKLNVTYGFRSNYAELKCVPFMYAVHFIQNNEVKIQEFYELIIGIAKTLKNIDMFKGVSLVMCKDLEYCYKGLKDYINFSFKTMFEKFPKLIL